MADAFRPDLAKSLRHVAFRLTKLSRHEEALTAGWLAPPRVATQQPDAFRPDLAMWLNNIALTLNDVGLGDEALARAEEAVALYRELAEARADAFGPDLASSLENLAKWRRTSAGRADLQPLWKKQSNPRELASQRPDAFQPSLRTSTTWRYAANQQQDAECGEQVVYYAKLYLRNSTTSSSPILPMAHELGQ